LDITSTIPSVVWDLQNLPTPVWSGVLKAGCLAQSGCAHRLDNTLTIPSVVWDLQNLPTPVWSGVLKAGFLVQSACAHLRTIWFLVAFDLV
jgi:hypothetical protein